MGQTRLQPLLLRGVCSEHQALLTPCAKEIGFVRDEVFPRPVAANVRRCFWDRKAPRFSTVNFAGLNSVIIHLNPAILPFPFFWKTGFFRSVRGNGVFPEQSHDPIRPAFLECWAVGRVCSFGSAGVSKCTLQRGNPFRSAPVLGRRGMERRSWHEGGGCYQGWGMGFGGLAGGMTWG